MLSGSNNDVFIVDDDVSIREALTRLLTAAGHHPLAFATASEFVDSGCYMGPGCAVLDVRLPDASGFDVYAHLQKSNVTMPVIFLTGFGEIPASVKAIKSGAIDYLSKPVNGDDLIVAIDTALAKEARLRSERSELSELRACYEQLTPRERQIMQLVLAGRLNKQIARELGISEKTVKVHRGRVMTKMRARRVAQLVQSAVRIGVVTPPAP